MSVLGGIRQTRRHQELGRLEVLRIRQRTARPHICVQVGCGLRHTALPSDVVDLVPGDRDPLTARGPVLMSPVPGQLGQLQAQQTRTQTYRQPRKVPTDWDLG